MPDVTTHTFREVVMLVDGFQLLVSFLVVYLLWRCVQVVRHVETIGRFWVRNWNDPQGNGGGATKKTTVVTRDGGE
jgi:hypothetical protein